MPHQSENQGSKTLVELELLVQYFEEAEEASRGARGRSELARDFYDNIQLTTDQKKKLKARGQPEVVFNLLAPKIDFLMGMETRARTDPKAFPRTPRHDEAADAVTDGLRYVLDKENFDEKASQGFETFLIEGTQGYTVEVELRGEDIEVVITRIRWDRFGIDPHSMEKDASDARYTFLISWKDLDDAQARWPDAKDLLAERMAQMGDLGQTYDDKPLHWFDKRRNRVMCVDMYFRHEQKWTHSIFTKGVWLERPEVSFYVDEDNEPVNPQMFASAKVKRDGQRYGPSEAMLDPQREVNSRRSKSLHLLTARQTFSKEGRIKDVNKFKREANKADGHIEFPNDGEFGKDFGIVPNESLAGPQFNMYLDAVERLDTQGANAALSGDAEGLSGKAVRSLQQGGVIELSPLFDIHSALKRRIYAAVWDRIKQFWDAERWVRVTDDENNLKFVGLNLPMTLAEQRIMEATNLTLTEVKQQFGDEIAEIHRRAPELAQIVQIENEIAEMDVDIILEDVPDVVNLQSEQFDLLVKMYQANPDGIDWEDVIAMSTLRNKDKILKKDLDPEQQQALEQRQEQEQVVNDIALQSESAKIRKTTAEAVGTEQKAIQTSVETELLLTAPPPDKVAII